MRISDWSSDVCSSDLQEPVGGQEGLGGADRRERLPARDVDPGVARAPASRIDDDGRDLQARGLRHLGHPAEGAVRLWPGGVDAAEAAKIDGVVDAAVSIALPDRSPLGGETNSEEGRGGKEG